MTSLSTSISYSAMSFAISAWESPHILTMFLRKTKMPTYVKTLGIQLVYILSKLNLFIVNIIQMEQFFYPKTESSPMTKANSHIL